MLEAVKIERNRLEICFEVELKLLAGGLDMWEEEKKESGMTSRFFFSHKLADIEETAREKACRTMEGKKLRF